ncbi:MAG: MBL fold metallo-hydrolase [Promethearchaeota archaeon]
MKNITKDTVKLTILIDDYNRAEEKFVLSYGFAALIEKNNKRILFDAGTKVEPLIKNLHTYGVLPSSLDAVILSHNHYDHTDGLPGILKENDKIPVYIHKDWDAPASFKGFQVPKKNRIVVKKAKEIIDIPGIFVTNSYLAPDYGGVYEHACFIKTNNAFILLCGCCHPGLNKFLKDRKILGIPQDAPLHLIGGMHGFKFSDFEAEKLYPIVKSVVLYHCTENTRIFQKQFKKKCFNGIVGKTLIF